MTQEHGWYVSNGCKAEGDHASTESWEACAVCQDVEAQADAYWESLSKIPDVPHVCDDECVENGPLYERPHCQEYRANLRARSLTTKNVTGV